ncbi:MAG: carbamoyltransferase HypF [Ardenticatenia bacterium]|nr:MAG: carbamoyltransferase HypF [Ardenticatenia bacterium]
MQHSASHSPQHRLRVEVHGAVQGVGFRPFVYRLATELGLTGWVINDTRGVFIEVEGSERCLHLFQERLVREAPPRALIQKVDFRWLHPIGYERFEIRHSDAGGTKTVLVLPDIATCGDCLREVFDPKDRRYRYPFTNCTNCGPRFTIIEALPYDRPNTTMRHFIMCPDCQAEYDQPVNRRFHAQPNACPVCGPHLALWSARGETLIEGDDAQVLQEAATGLRQGLVVAVKGLGGFHLMVDARNTDAVTRLRQRKRRPHRPLALMVRDLDQARALCHVSDEAAQLLMLPEAPILLLPRLPDAAVADNVAPDNPNLGVMLPYTPLHHLLLRMVDFPVVATSGNLTDEPICIDEHEALRRLGDVADLFLVHNRPITRHADDSVMWIVDGRPQLLRRARGYAPLPVTVAQPLPTILGVGAHLKNTVALSVGSQVFISQHIGDLETLEATLAFERVIADFLRLYEARPVAIAHDLHPDYVSTRWAQEALQTGQIAHVPIAAEELKLVAVQHHHAHLAACLAENKVSGTALGVTWDGTGYGTDGTVWGGEFLLGDAADFVRIAHLRPFRLPGGEAAVLEPCRVALALLWEMGGETAWERDDLAPLRQFSTSQKHLLAQMLRRGVNAPITTSVGRLFDGVAALVGLHQQVSFEGQAAMALEFAADPSVREAYPFPLEEPQDREGDAMLSKWILDWQPLLVALLEDLQRKVPVGIIAARFHNALVEGIVAVSRQVGHARVVLSGGCFQNRWLTERSAARLRRAGFEVLLHHQVPPNDGCVSLGQVTVAAAQLARDRV